MQEQKTGIRTQPGCKITPALRSGTPIYQTLATSQDINLAPVPSMQSLAKTRRGSAPSDQILSDCTLNLASNKHVVRDQEAAPVFLRAK